MFPYGSQLGLQEPQLVAQFPPARGEGEECGVEDREVFGVEPVFAKASI